MKKIITLALVLTTITLSSFADPIVKVTPETLSSFNKSYADAQDVQWESVGTNLRVSFRYSGQQLTAYYRTDGQQIAVSRNLVSTQLPLNLANELKARFDSQWLTDLLEISSNGETTYFATLRTAEHITVLRAEPTGSWTVYSKTKTAVD